MLKRQKSQVSHFDFADFPTVFSWLCLHIGQCVDGENHSKGEGDDTFRFEMTSTSELQNQRLHPISPKDLWVQVEGQSKCSQSISTTEAMPQWISNKLPWLVTSFASWRSMVSWLQDIYWNICKHDKERLVLFLTAAILARSRFGEVQNAASSSSCHHVVTSYHLHLPLP